MYRHPMHRNLTSGRTAALIHKIAHADIGDAGIYFLDDECLQWDEPGLAAATRGRKAEAWTSNLLGVLTAKHRKRHGLRRDDQWDFVAIMGDIFGEMPFMCIALHEFCHRVAATVPPPSPDQIIAIVQSSGVDALFAKYAVTDASSHDARFDRGLAHLWSRARLKGTTLPLNLLHPPVPVATFEKCIQALTGEIVANLTGSISALLDTPAPASFMSLVGHLGYQTRATRELPLPTSPVTAPPRPAAPRPTKPTQPTPARPSAEWEARVRKAMARTAESPYAFGVIYV